MGHANRCPDWDWCEENKDSSDEHARRECDYKLCNTTLLVDYEIDFATQELKDGIWTTFSSQITFQNVLSAAMSASLQKDIVAASINITSPTPATTMEFDAGP